MTVRSYLLPRTLPEALDQLDRHGPELLVIAGGTVAMPLINDGVSLPGTVMGLRLAGLDGIEATRDTVWIGATTTLTRLLDVLDVPMLQDAARSTGAWAVRNMATVGGNLFTPPPGGDVAVALLALDASVTLASTRGDRVLPLADLFTGFMTTALAVDELLVAIDVPIPRGRTAYIKLGRRLANTPAVVTVAVHATWDAGLITGPRIALGAVGPHPIRAHAAERLLAGTRLDPDAIAAAATAAAEGCEPFTDGIASDWYRRRMTAYVVARALEQLAQDAPGEGR